MIKKEANPMARTSTYTCKTCGTTYEFCLKCQVARPDYDAENFCSHNHADIYAALSKHGCNLIAADEALKELAALNIDEVVLAEDVLAHFEKIKSEATVKTETPVVKAENPIVEEVVEKPAIKAEQPNKKQKKKW